MGPKDADESPRTWAKYNGSGAQIALAQPKKAAERMHSAQHRLVVAISDRRYAFIPALRVPEIFACELRIHEADVTKHASAVDPSGRLIFQVLSSMLRMHPGIRGRWSERRGRCLHKIHQAG